MGIHSAEQSQARIDELQVEIGSLEREVQTLVPRLKWMRWINNAYIVAVLAVAYAVAEGHLVLGEFQIACAFIIAVTVFPVGQGGDLALSLKKSELRRLRSDIGLEQEVLELHRRKESTPPDGNVDVWRPAANGRFELVATELGDGSKGVEVARWFVEVGDRVGPKQPIADVMYDLWTIEVPSQRSGVVEAVCVEIGDDVPMGTTLCVVRTEPASEVAAS